MTTYKINLDYAELKLLMDGEVIHKGDLIIFDNTRRKKK